MNNLKWPDFLHAGDHVAIVATARHAKEEEIRKGVSFLESWGLKVSVAENLFTPHYIFAGTEAQRRKSLQQVLDDSSVKAVFCLRGGYGTHRLVDFLHYHGIKKNPKWIIGYSDVTVLLNHVAQFRIPAIHGPMPFSFHKPEEQEGADLLKKLLFGEVPSYRFHHHKLNHEGIGEGKIIGGNISVLHAMTGTASDISWKNKILFIEEVGEYIYHIERMLYHFSRMGRMKDLSGVVVGHLTSIQDNPEPFGLSVCQVIQRVVKPYKLPLAFSFPAGHDLPNWPLIIGAPAKLVVTSEGSTLTYLR